jgi:hypothetical protein
MIVARASESLHWYRRDGTPQYTVKAKDGSDRPTTLRDARKMDLVPSVTTIIKCAASPGLEAWKIQQMMLAAMTLPRAADEAEDLYIQRVIADSKEQGRKAAERGTEIHAALESYFETGVLTASHGNFQSSVEDAVIRVFGDRHWSTEKAFAHEAGFGGKIDLHTTDNDGVVIDFKTKEFTQDNIEKISGYDENLMQLAAYRVGLNLPRARCANVFVSVTEPGLVKVYEWEPEDLDRGWKMFEALMKYWYAKSNL